MPKGNDLTGALYYYERPDRAIRYVFKQKLVASDGVPGDALGMLNRLASDGKVLIAGNLSDRKVYVFVKPSKLGGWEEAAKIEAPDECESFVETIAVSGSKIILSSSTYELEAC